MVSFNGLCSSGLVCAVCLYPREVGPIVADPKTLAVNLTDVVLCNGLVVRLLVISPKEV
jgi:hypothetical protein